MNIVYATATTNVGLREGGTILIGAGTHWPDDDPIVQDNPWLFSTDARYGLVFTVEPEGFGEPPVETATAAPGERRNIRR